MERVETAITEMEAAGWVDSGVLSVFQGPREYLYGEETACSKPSPVVHRFPASPRRGAAATELVEDADGAASESGSLLRC